MCITYNHKAIATAEFADEKHSVRYRLTVTRRNDNPTARFTLDGFNSGSADAVLLYNLAHGTWLDFVAALPAVGMPAADIANAARACFEQVMAL